MVRNVKLRRDGSRAALVAVAVLAFVLAILRAPSLEMCAARVVATRSEETKTVVTSELARVPIASRGEPHGRPHTDAVLDTCALANGSPRSACVMSRLREPTIAPRATWAPGAKTQSDLMVFLN